MDTNAGATIETWYPSIKQWRQEDIDHSMNIKARAEFYIHFLDCPNHSQLIGEEPAPESTPNKWRFEADDQYESLTVQARPSTASTWLPSPTSSNLSASQPYSHSISISPSPFSSVPSSPKFHSPSLPTTPSNLSASQPAVLPFDFHFSVSALIDAFITQLLFPWSPYHILG